MGADIMLGLQEKRVVKHTKDFNEIEKRVIETVLNDSIFKHGINYTNHSQTRRTQRNISLGRIRMAVQMGQVMEVEFTKEGHCTVQVSFATGSQLGRGYTTYAVYDCSNGNVISVWNKQNKSEHKLNTSTYIGDKQYLQKHESCLQYIYDAMGYNENDTSLVDLVRKYNKAPLQDKKLQRKLENYQAGITKLHQM